MPKIFQYSTKSFDLNKGAASQSSPPQFLRKGFSITARLDVVSCFNLQNVFAVMPKKKKTRLYGMNTFNFIGVCFLPAV